MPEERKHALTLKVAIITRMTFSFTAACATVINRGMMSYFLQNFEKVS